MPASAPVGSSATMAPISEIVMATFRLANRKGTAAGQRSFQSTWRGVADQVRINSICSGSGEVKPFTMPIAIGKKQR